MNKVSARTADINQFNERINGARFAESTEHIMMMEITSLNPGIEICSNKMRFQPKQASDMVSSPEYAFHSKF